MNRCIYFALSFLILAASPTLAQHVAPTHKDIAYDNDHPAQKLDVYLAKSDVPLPVMIHIHGGGWRAGSKSNVPAWLKDGLNAGQFSVVSVEYRFTDVAPHPAQTDDCMRAIQFVRSNAKAWNIDTSRFGVTGGSAGGHLSLWVALHDDIADSAATDSVERESSRVTCAVGFAGPTDWRLLSQIKHAHPAYRQLLGYEPGTPADEMKSDGIKDVSPISFVSQDDPPIMIVHGDADNIVPVEHAKQMDSELKKSGVKSTLVVVKGAGHEVASAGGPSFVPQVKAFVSDAFDVSQTQ
ncbi:MAG: alpha/beta hydrolase [Pirellulaceae bacterium]